MAKQLPDPAETFDDLRRRFAENKIAPQAMIFDPRNKAWYRPEAYIPGVVSMIPATTTHHIDGFSVAQYIDIVSVEIVIGTGLWSEWTGGISDFLGERSRAYLVLADSKSR